MQLEQVKISESLQNIARIGVVFLDEVANGPCDPALTREIEETCEKLRLRLAGRKPAEIEALAPARKLYRRTGGDPTRERPSSERLLRRALKGHNLAKINRLVDCINLVSLDKRKWRDDGYKDVREIDVVENKRSVSPTKREQKNDLIRLVTKGLSRNERLIVILYYYEEMTMKEIGSTLSLSESRVSQMHSSIVRRLQNQLDNRRTEFAA